MKKLFIILGVCAIAFSSCQIKENLQLEGSKAPVIARTVVVTETGWTEDGTKSGYVEGEGVKLTGEEKLGVVYEDPAAEGKYYGLDAAQKYVILANPSGNWKYSFKHTGGLDSYNYYFVLPYTYSATRFTGSGIVYTKLSPVQNPGQNSFDPNYDVMIGKPIMGVPKPTESTTDAIEIHGFKRMFTPLRIDITDSGNILGSEKIHAVTLKFSQEPTKTGLATLVGNFTLQFSENFEDAKVSGLQDQYAIGNAVTALYAEGLECQGNEYPVWYMVNPITISGGTSMTITVSTQTKTVTREVDLTADLKIEKDKINWLSFDISGNGYKGTSSMTTLFTDLADIKGSATEQEVTLPASDGESYIWKLTGSDLKRHSESGKGSDISTGLSMKTGTINLPLPEGKKIKGLRIYGHAANGTSGSGNCALDINYDGKTITGDFDYLNKKNSELLKNGGIMDISLEEYTGGPIAITEGKSTSGTVQTKVISAITYIYEGGEFGDTGEEEEEDDLPGTHTVKSASELNALGTLQPGDVVIWEDGTYADQVFTLNSSGTAESPIILKAQTKGGVTFTGTSSVDIKGSHIKVSGFKWQDPALDSSDEHLIYFRQESSYCTLEDCAIDGRNRPLSEEGHKWVSIDGYRNTVTHCEFTNKNDRGALLVMWFKADTPGYHTVSYNKFSRPSSILDDKNEAMNEQETIRVGDSGSSSLETNCLFEGNYFYECNGEMAEVVSNKTCKNTYIGNYFHLCNGNLSLRHGNNCVVRGNYFLGDFHEETNGETVTYPTGNMGGIRVYGEGHVVENNHLERLNSSGFKAAICLGSGEESPAASGYFNAKNSIIKNNVIVDCYISFEINYSKTYKKLVDNITIEGNTVASMAKSHYAIRYYPDAETVATIIWKDNTIYGKHKNLPESYGLTQNTSKRPEVTDVSAQREAIRNASGLTK